MKKITSLFAVLALCLSMTVVPAFAAEVPEAWFELGYKEGTPYDVKGNLEVEIQAGEVIDTTVTHNGTQYPVTAFVGDDDQEGMLVSLPFEDGESYGAFLLGGCTYEMFVELETLRPGTSGFFTCCNGGGSSLYYRGQDGLNQIQFQIGCDDTTGATNTWGTYAGAAAAAAKDGPAFFEAGKLVHVVGTYNKDTNTLSVYKDGVLASEGLYGQGGFNLGSAYEDVLGIGLNPAYPSESLAEGGNEFRVVTAKLYKTCLTADEVAAEYASCIASVTGEAAAVEEPVAEEEPAVEAPVVEEVVAEAPAVEEAVVEEVVTAPAAAPVAEKAPQTFNAAVIGAVSAIVSLAGYTLSKKH